MKQVAEKAAGISRRLADAYRVADALAHVMMTHYGGEYTVTWDESEHDPRTGLELKDSPGAIKLQVDKSCDRLARSYLTALYPDYGCVGEESFDPEDMKTDPFWLVDPICGSMAFYRRSGFFGTSIALIDRQKGPRLGVMNCPALNIRGLADLDEGVFFLHGDHPPQALRPERRIVMSPNSAEHPLIREMIAVLAPETLELRESIPAKALAVAHGSFGLNFGPPKKDTGFAVKIWDMGAAIALFRAAGLVIVDFDGRDLTVTGASGKVYENGYIMARDERMAEAVLKSYAEVTAK